MLFCEEDVGFGGGAWKSGGRTAVWGGLGTAVTVVVNDRGLKIK